MKIIQTCTYKFEHVPIKHVVIGKALSVEQIPEELPQVWVVWLVIKSQWPAKVEVRGKFSCGTEKYPYYNPSVLGEIQSLINLQKMLEITQGFEHTWVAFAKNFNGGGHLLFTDTLILLSLGGGFQSLPRQWTQVEVHQHIAKRLQVIPPRLLYKDRCTQNYRLI